MNLSARRLRSRQNTTRAPPIKMAPPTPPTTPPTTFKEVELSPLLEDPPPPASCAGFVAVANPVVKVTGELVVKSPTLVEPSTTLVILVTMMIWLVDFSADVKMEVLLEEKVEDIDEENVLDPRDESSQVSSCHSFSRALYQDYKRRK